MKKRTLSLLLMLCMALSLLTASAVAAESDFVIKDGMLTEYRGPGGDVVIPDGVTELAARGVFGTLVPEITSITVPGSVKKLTVSIFAYTQGLTRVVLQDGVQSIESGAMGFCPLLTSLYIPPSVTEIDSGALRSVWFYADDASVECKDLVIYGEPGSVAEAYAKEQGVPFKAGPAPTEQIDVAYRRDLYVERNGEEVWFSAFALKDSGGNETNYVRVREAAGYLDGTSAQFNVSWDGAVNLEPGKPYDWENGGSDAEFVGAQKYVWSPAATNVDGTNSGIEAILITDSEGNGHTYYKLRDLGGVLGFTVGWDETRGVYIETPGMAGTPST